MLTIKKNLDGNIELSIEDAADRADLQSDISRKDRDTIWADLFEPFRANGSYTPISPEQFSIGLTSDPYIIAEEFYIGDDGYGSYRIRGCLFHYPNYMVTSAIDELAKGEMVTLVKFHDTKGKTERLWEIR